MWIELGMIAGLLYAYISLGWIFWWKLQESGLLFWMADSLLTNYILIRNRMNVLHRKLYRELFIQKGFRIKEAVLVGMPPHAKKVTSDVISYTCISRPMMIGLLERNGYYANHYDFFQINPYLEILYTYDGIPYKMIYDYRGLQDVPVPWMSEKILEDYKKDIILPHFRKRSVNHSMYQLFRECDPVEYVELDGERSEVIRKRLALYAGPLNDYGSLYLNPIQVRHLLTLREQGVFRKLVIKFAKGYLCEEEFEMKDHMIVCQSLTDTIQSERIKEKIRERLKEERKI